MTTPVQVPKHSEVRGFASTHWTIVFAAARGDDSSHAAQALAELCRTYWYPLYAFLRRRGHDAHESEDLTQGFFANLLSRDFLASIDRQKGQFRTFLLASLKHFLADERDRATALKRGGGQAILSLDGSDAESRYRREPAHDLSPEKMFEKQWALSLLERVLGRLQVEMSDAGKQGLFEALQGTLIAGDTTPYAVIAENLSMSENAVKTAAHRLRRRFRDLLIDEIAQTVAERSEVEDEIRYLMSCL